MSDLLLHIADRVLNRPLMVTPDKAQVILQVLAGRIGVSAPEASRFEGSDFVEDEPGRFRERPYRVANGVAIITIVGTLVNRGAWVGAYSGKTSYEGIQHQIKTALGDPAVHAVILDMSSPGGEAVGAFETAAMVRQLAARKRTVAIVNGMMASAAYAIGSGAHEIVTTETGVSGSIGVVLLHADFSRNLENEGIKPTLIFAGTHKVDGNPFEPLPDAVRADLQSEVNAFYEKFLTTVAEGRGERMNADAARATGARTQIGDAAVKAGLADRVGTFESVLADLQQTATRASARPTLKGKSMDASTDKPAAEAGISQTEHDAAVAAAEKKGFDAAMTRVASVLSAVGVKGDPARMSAALDLAVMAPGKSATEVAAYVNANVAATPVATSATAAAVLDKMDKAAEGIASQPSATGTAADGGMPKATTPDGWKAEWGANADLQAEYPSADAYVATKRREQLRAA